MITRAIARLSRKKGLSVFFFSFSFRLGFGFGWLLAGTNPLLVFDVGGAAEEGCVGVVVG